MTPAALTMSSSRNKKSPGIEESLDQLEHLVAKLEAGDLSLEDSLKAFEEGIRLTRECQEKLAAAEQKVQVLLEKHGDISTVPFEGIDDEIEDDEDE